jgi:hypothetical protein
LERMVCLSEAVLGLEKKKSVRVTPEEAGPLSCAGYQVLSLHPESRSGGNIRPTSSYWNTSHLESKSLGGMDILADIICHVPPMAVPETTTQSCVYSHNSYHLPQHHESFPKNIPAIPSYQEIYREMGMTSQYPSADNHHKAEDPPLHHPLPKFSYPRPNAYTVETISECDANNAHRTAYYGHPMSGEMEEGKELYTRKDLMVMGGHLLEHKDVHGSMKEGADSVVLCHLVSVCIESIECCLCMCLIRRLF